MPNKKVKERPVPTITFQPDPDVLAEIVKETAGKPRGYQSKIINETLRVALATVREADAAAEKARREVLNRNPPAKRH